MAARGHGPPHAMPPPRSNGSNGIVRSINTARVDARRRTLSCTDAYMSHPLRLASPSPLLIADGTDQCLKVMGKFRLLEPVACAVDDPAQRFFFDEAARAFVSKSDPTQCVKYLADAGALRHGSAAARRASWRLIGERGRA